MCHGVVFSPTLECGANRATSVFCHIQTHTPHPAPDQVILYILLVMHWVACGWHLLADVEDADMSW